MAVQGRARIRDAQELIVLVTGILRKTGQRFQRRMTLEHLSGPTGATSLARRSGQLARSLSYISGETQGRAELLVFVGGGVPYARIHEFGGTVIPKKAKMLAIPLGVARTAAGVGRGTSPRSWPVPLRVIKLKDGRLFLIEALKRGGGTKAGGKPQFVFRLKDSVTLPARMNFRRTFKDETRQALSEVRDAVRTLTISPRKS